MEWWDRYKKPEVKKSILEKLKRIKKDIVEKETQKIKNNVNKNELMI